MHFFIEHTQLTDQAVSGDGFGPSTADPTTKYDVSANFQLASEAKAFACQSGSLIVTDSVDVTTGVSDPALVNVILKPRAGLGLDFPTVKYYIYRGLKRDSFFSSGGFNAEGASNTDTVRTMWEDWHANAANSPDPIAATDLGFDPTLAGTDLIEDVFGNALVALDGTPLRARQVSEGEWIGTFGFSKKICFEVIVEAELLTLDMEYARKSMAQVDISAMTAIASPTPIQTHTLRCKKEEILAYVDPAALFGMHFSVGVSGSGFAKVQKRGDLVTNFLIKFSTATRVYVDIRSEKGYSYNFYDNYGGGGANPHLIRIKPGSAAFSDDLYYNQGWPLFSQADWTGPGSQVQLQLRLRVDDNTEPLLFVEDARRLRSGSSSKNFLDKTKLKDGAAADWSKSIRLRLQGSGSTGSKVCVATHVRMQYLRQNSASPTVNARLLQFNHHLDTVFGGIDLPIGGSMATFADLRNEKVGLSEGPDFAHVSGTGMYFDPDVVLLYGEAKVAQRTNPESYPTADFATSTLDNVVRSPVFPSDIVFSRWSIVEGGITVGVIDLSVCNKGTKNTSIDGIHFLGLKRNELSRLQATVGFGPVHQRFLVFEEAADQLDDNDFPYKKYELKVQGLDAAGMRRLVAPAPAVHVFGAGANMFCSSDFADSVNLPDVPPDPRRMQEWDHVHSAVYGPGDASVDAAVPTGRITANDIGNEFGSSKPSVRVRARYFFPIDKKGDTTLSTRSPPYPLVVIAHANGSRFTEYDFLGKFLAQNGFIVASVNLLISKSTVDLVELPIPHPTFLLVKGSSERHIVHKVTGAVHQVERVTGIVTVLPTQTDFDVDLVARTIEYKKGPRDLHHLASRGRANVIFKHLQVLKEKFGADVQNKIGLIGHSRGGEAVVRVADQIVASTPPGPTDLDHIAAVISLAPTDRYEKEDLTKNVPYFVLYGSRDGDVNGSREARRKHLTASAAAALSPRDRQAGSGGFSLYDRASNTTVKSMAFVYGANHNGFITSRTRDPVKISTLPNRTQRATTLSYMNAFMRQHLRGESIWNSYFTGEFIPPSTGTSKIFLQYKEMRIGKYQTIDDFEDVAIHDWATSSSGLPVSHSRAATDLEEGLLNPFPPSIDIDSPHETYGLKVSEWAANDSLTFTITNDVAGDNIDVFSYLSFRIAQVARRKNDSIDSLKVVLEDALGSRFAAPLGRTVPRPHSRPVRSLIKSAFLTVRIPLALYRDNGVDLERVKRVQFEFPSTGTGNIEIDDVEFSS